MSNPFTVQLRPHWINGQAIYTVVVTDENGESKWRTRSDLANEYHRNLCVDKLKTITGKPAEEINAEILSKIQEDEAAIANAMKADAFQIKSISSSELAAKRSKPSWLAKRIAVEKQPLVIGGGRKSLKTSISVDATISFGTATMFLGVFEVPHVRRVLFMSAESGEWTIRETAHRIALSKGIALSSIDTVRWAFEVPQLSRADHLDSLRTHILEHGSEIAIVDPLYLALLAGNRDANAGSMFDIGPILLNVAKVCLDVNCTPVLNHHNTKASSRSFEPPDLEDLAWAGIAEFARQWILIGRREPYEHGSGMHRLWLNVGGSAGFGGLHAVDIDEGVIDDEFTGRKWDVTVKGSTQARAEIHEKEAEKRSETKAAKQQALYQANRASVVKAFERFPDGETKTTVRDTAGVESKKFTPILADLLAEKIVEQCQVAKGNKQSYEGFRLTRSHPDTPGYPTASD